MKLAIGGFVLCLVAVLIMHSSDCEQPDGTLSDTCKPTTAADCAAHDARC